MKEARRGSLLRSFFYAFAGLGHLFRTQRNARIHAAVGTAPAGAKPMPERDPMRPSHFAAIYMLAEGYDVIPVNPRYAGETILGQQRRIVGIQHHGLNADPGPRGGGCRRDRLRSRRTNRGGIRVRSRGHAAHPCWGH